MDITANYVPSSSIKVRQWEVNFNSKSEGNGNPLQYNGLENPMDGGAWQATVHGVPKSRTPLSDFHSLRQASTCIPGGNGNCYHLWRSQADCIDPNLKGT